ncbi:MAG: proline--tRNA ligase [Candidatus Shapirobacteria bacterium]|nr:proline--tRNA ligase [Candidatus Shapirobacteria bacterium]
MRYSKLFGKTIREIPKDIYLTSHQLLYKAGFIRELVAGRYFVTNLGYRVINKIVKVIDEEMEMIGSQRVMTPTLHPLSLWQATHRDEAFGESLMKVKDRRGSEFVIGATHEAAMTEFVKKFQPTFKDLPIIVHQFSSKFRDEVRARGGLIRLREFLMKDAYSFAADDKQFMETYWDQYNAYLKIAQRLGIKVQPVEADAGALGGDFSHEFMALTEKGEDTFVTCTNCDYAANTEKAQGILEDKNSQEKEMPLEEIEAKRGLNMEEMALFYKVPLWRLLKTIIFMVQGKSVAICIRGDLEINEIKLGHILKTADFRIPEPEEIKKLGTVRGFVSPLNLKVDCFLIDKSVLSVKNLITGANKLNVDYKNFNYPRDLKNAQIVDIALVNNEFKCQKCQKGNLKLKRAIEFGHTFKYDDFYSKALDAYFTNKDGQQKLLLMGAYGIGIERAMAIIVEQNNDERGIIWPKSVSPFDVQLISIEHSTKCIVHSEEVYKELQKNDIEVLYDDREEVSAGAKFADADLIGIPVRLVVSERAGDKIEWKNRDKKETELLNLKEVIKKLSL